MPRIQLRRDTSSNWSSTNPTLYAGEIGVETDTMSYKLGNGSTNWNSLAYTSLPDGVNDGDVLTWNSSTNSWQAEAPTGGGGSLPNGTSDGQVLTWDGTNSSWSAEAVPTELPSATDGQVLTWTSSTNAWIAATPSAAGLPSGTADGQVLTWDSMTSSWVGEAVPAELPSGTNDGQVLTWDGMNNSWGAESVPTELPSSATTGHVLTWTSNNAWEPQAPAGGSATLPNGTVNMEPLVYDAGNSSWYAAGTTNSGGFLAYNQGSYGFNGIRSGPSDAQAGDILRYTGTYWEAQPFVPAGTNSTNGDILYWNSGAGTWSTGGLAPTTANILYFNSNNSWALGGLTSMNGAPNNGDVLTYDASNARWIAGAPGGLPGGTTDGQVLTWDGMNNSWGAESVPTELPSSATTGQVLTWTSNNAWAAETPNAAGLPSANHTQILQYDSSTSSWQAGVGLAPLGSDNNDLLVWHSSSSAWIAAGLSGLSGGHVIFHNGSQWQTGGLTSGPTGFTPNNGDVLTWNSTGSYWAAASATGGGGASLPNGSGEHDILVWNTSSSSWLSLGLSGISDGHMLHVGASGSNWVLGGKTSSGGNPSTNDFMYWNGNNWLATGFGVTSGNHALTYNGSNWEATATPASSSVVIVDVSSSSHTLSFVNGVLTGYTIT